MTPEPADGPSQGPKPTVPAPEIPDHEMLRIIGTGSYGEVWLARNIVGTPRAVKVVRRNRFQEERPYEREFTGIQKFEPISRNHEGLMDVLQMGRNDKLGYFYYVMELADDAGGPDNPQSGPPTPPGRKPPFRFETYCPHTLALEISRRGRLPVLECIQRGLSLSLALEHLHGLGLVHRDIKPSNVIFVNGTPKLADIGTVTEVGAVGSMVGTLGFMPPEGPGTPEADVFSLGKVLYEISTGKNSEQWPKPVTLLAEMSDREEWLELNEVVARACATDLKERYKSASELRGDLALLLGGKSVRRLRAREKRFKQVAAAAALVALAGLVWTGVQRAAEQTRWRELREAELLRRGVRIAGWTTEHEAHLKRAAKIHVDGELRDQAMAALVGLDMRRVASFDSGGSSLAYGQDGNVLFAGLSLNHDQTNTPARMWSPRSRRLEELKGNGDGPVGFDARGTPIQFVSSGNGRFVLLDLLTGQTRREFRIKGEPITGHDSQTVLALAPDGLKVAAAVATSAGGWFAVWDSQSGNELGELDQPVTALAFSPSGNAIATGDKDGHARVWSVPRLTRIVELPRARGVIESIAFGNDAACGELTNPYPWLVAIGDNAASISVWEMTTGDLRSRCRGSAYDILALAFSPDSTILASAGRQEMWLWDAATGDHLLRNDAGGKLDYVRGLAFCSDSRHVAVATGGVWRTPPSASVWELDEARGIKTLRGLQAQARRVWWSPDGRRLVALAEDWELGVWAMPQGHLTHLVRVPPGFSADNAAVVFHPDGNRIAFATGNEVCCYDLRARMVLRKWQVPPGFCDALRFDSQDSLLFLHSEEENEQKPRRMWALFKLLLPPSSDSLIPTAHQEETNWVTWATALPAGADYFLVAGGLRENPYQSAVIAREILTTRKLWELPTPCHYWDFGLFLDPTGKAFAFPTAPSARRAALVHLPEGRIMENLAVLPDAISPSGTQFAKTSKSGLSFWGGRNFKNNANLAIDFNCLDPQFSPDGKQLAWATAEGLVLVADLNEVQRRLNQLGWEAR